jgi:hypothetical protein
MPDDLKELFKRDEAQATQKRPADEFTGLLWKEVES